MTYDVNTNTNYNPEVEAAAPRSGPRQIARSQTCSSGVATLRATEEEGGR